MFWLLAYGPKAFGRTLFPPSPPLARTIGVGNSYPVTAAQLLPIVHGISRADPLINPDCFPGETRKELSAEVARQTHATQAKSLCVQGAAPSRPPRFWSFRAGQKAGRVPRGCTSRLNLYLFEP